MTWPQAIFYSVCVVTSLVILCTGVAVGMMVYFIKKEEKEWNSWRPK